jgi:hypothetical protein
VDLKLSVIMESPEFIGILESVLLCAELWKYYCNLYSQATSFNAISPAAPCEFPWIDSCPVYLTAEGERWRKVAKMEPPPDHCCIRRGTGGNRILDVIPRWTELELLGIRRGIWGGCTHSAIIPKTSLWSSSFIKTLSSPFGQALQTQTNSSTQQLLYIHYRTHGSCDKHLARPSQVCLQGNKSINKYWVTESVWPT